MSRATTEEPEARGALAIGRDGQGWPLAFRQPAGSAPGFDLGDRAAGHERGDVLLAVRLTLPRLRP